MTILHDYQEEALEFILEAFQKKAAALAVMATGLGKTIVAAFWTKSELKKNHRGLFLCHDNGILEQAMGEFRKVLGNDVVFSPFFGAEKDKDFNADKAEIVFASFQSYVDWKIVFPEDWFDFIIVDESHHGQARTFKEVIQYFKPKKLLGITATPDRMDMKDIREIFGDEVVNYTLEEAIAKSWLTQVEYRILNDNLKHWKLKRIVKDVLGEGQRISVKQLNESIFIKKRDEEIAKIIQEYAGSSKKAIIFCEKIQHAENFQQYLPGALTYHSRVTGGAKENRRRLEAFRDGSLQYILAVDKFNEGIDIPDAELIVFLRCTDSKTIFYQQLGRGLRKIFGKEKVFVLDFVANCERIVTIKEMAKKVKYFIGNGFELSKDSLHVSGSGFDFIFNDDQVEILKLIDRAKPLFISDIPHLLKEYDLERAELPPDQVRAGTNRYLPWKCEKGHRWISRGNNRLMGRGCPQCHILNKNKYPISSTHPDIAKQYSKKNLIPVDRIFAGSKRKCLWECQNCGHVFKREVSYRTKFEKLGCPACAGLVPKPSDYLPIAYPKLVKFYSPNNKLPVEKVVEIFDEYLWICKSCKSEYTKSLAMFFGSKKLCENCEDKIRKRKK